STTDLPAIVVQTATQSPYVHASIVLSVASQEGIEDPILIAESHIDISVPSVGTGKRNFGVQTHWLGPKLANRKGKAWWAPLKEPLPDRRLTKMQAWLREIEQQQVAYDIVQAVEAGITAMSSSSGTMQADESALFCSELVARALQIAGALDNTVNPSEQTPADVMNFACLHPPILIQDC
ncbi:MAG: hypothetical protein VKJ24_02645, partial [Synechococcales bacterium]|nr:hypothetical protein [Synechococcales bacterium]